MLSTRRVLIMAEMHGRDLLRRRAVLLLLIALPLAFYLSAGHTARFSVTAGGVGMAFAIAGATLFSTLSSAEVDQRLVLGGYRPAELLLGRLLFLGPLGLAIAGAFSVMMVGFADPVRPWLLVLGVALVALQSVPLGLAVGTGVARELEGTLVIIGVVGIQMAAAPDSVIAKLLPFYQPQQLILAGVEGHGPVLGPLVWTAAYGLALLGLARIFVGSRLDVAAHRARAESGPAKPWQRSSARR